MPASSPASRFAPWLVTAGPTREPVDAVRYLGNRSSGRLGLEIARSAATRGIPTTLLLGPTYEPAAVEDPRTDGLAIERFETAADLEALLADRWPRRAGTLVMAAAVADYRPIRRSDAEGTKIRRGDAPLLIECEPVPDLVAACARRAEEAGVRADRRIVAFALEPAADLEQRARAKLRRKGVDAIVANALETMEGGDVRAGHVRLAADDRRLDPPPDTTDKTAFAEWLVASLIAAEPV